MKIRAPLRRIVKREQQGKLRVTVLVCGHVTVRLPLTRLSCFLPCPTCQKVVEAYRSAHPNKES